MTKPWPAIGAMIIPLLLASCGVPQQEDRPSAASRCALAPAYSAKNTLFGTSLSSGDGTLDEALTTNQELFGHLPVVRQFDPGIPASDAWSRRGALRDRAIVTSFRATPDSILAGDHDEDLLEYFRSAPGGSPIFWSYYHEPEPAIEQGDFTADEYRNAWEHLTTLISSLCRKNLFPTLILTGWTADERSGRNWQDYYAGSEYISVLAWDPYNSATETPTSYAPPHELFDPVIRIAETSEKPWGIAETGSALVPGDDGTERAKWLDETAAYLESAEAAFVTYFQSTHDGDFKLDDDPSIHAWRHWVHLSNTPVFEVAPRAMQALPHTSGKVSVSVSTLDGGAVDAVEQPVEAFKFPAFSTDAEPPRAALVVRSTEATDVLTPHASDFSFGVDAALDSTSSGSPVDNGDNVIQRGISSDSTIFKLELDSRRPACTVRGSAGELIVRSTVEMLPEHWYRISCHKQGEELELEVTDLESPERIPARRVLSGSMGSLDFNRAVPVAIGGKVAVNGELIRSATDQFNGLITNAFLRITP